MKGRHTGREVAPEQRSRGGGPHWQGSREMGEAVPEGRSSGPGWRGGFRRRPGKSGAEQAAGGARGSRLRKMASGIGLLFFPAEGREYKTG